MSYLRNAWYCAAWSNELSREPLGRELLSEKLVFYRKENGQAVGLSDVCPHRFAPLHVGTVVGDAIACRYHGLRFGESGACVHNPHDTRISPLAKVKAYPVAERHRMIWAWMGDPALADEFLIPALPEHDRSTSGTTYDLHNVKGAYGLIADNLLDLSHAQYLHPLLVEEKAQTFTLQEEDGAVIEDVISLDQEKNPLFQFLWPDGPERVDTHAWTRWEAPAYMRLSIEIRAAGGSSPGISFVQCHIVTPETPTSCHYFWSLTRDYRLDDAAFGEEIKQAVGALIRNEDVWMIERCQENMGLDTDLLAMNRKFVTLKSDACTVRARVRLAALIEQEQAS